LLEAQHGARVVARLAEVLGLGREERSLHDRVTGDLRALVDRSRGLIPGFRRDEGLLGRFPERRLLGERGGLGEGLTRAERIARALP
jgi:hypothetical protein